MSMRWTPFCYSVLNWRPPGYGTAGLPVGFYRGLDGAGRSGWTRRAGAPHACRPGTFRRV